MTLRTKAIKIMKKVRHEKLINASDQFIIDGITFDLCEDIHEIYMNRKDKILHLGLTYTFDLLFEYIFKILGDEEAVSLSSLYINAMKIVNCFDNSNTFRNDLKLIINEEKNQFILSKLLETIWGKVKFELYTYVKSLNDSEYKELLNYIKQELILNALEGDCNVI